MLNIIIYRKSHSKKLLNVRNFRWQKIGKFDIMTVLYGQLWVKQQKIIE